ncbi:MAG: hypothetical protein HPY78_03330 [Brevinematales bacterium]|nr:hypothetical protein [Brevinematales bacterium]
MSFWEYLIEILKYPLRGKAFESLFKAISTTFDQLKNDIYLLRKQFIPFLSDHLLRFAEERGIDRFPYETEENYKKRILFAYTFLLSVSNNKEINKLLSFLIQKPFSIRETKKWRLGVSKLGVDSFLNLENRCAIEFYTSLSEKEKLYLFSVLRFYLPAHVELFLIEPQAQTIRWRLGYSLLGKNTVLKEDI